MSNYVGPTGNKNAKLLVVGEAPGGVEDEYGKPFIGPSGQLLDEIFTSLGHPDWREEVYLTNCYKFRPPGNNIRKIDEVCNPKEQLDLLDKEIREVNPNCILALGGTALSILTGKDGIKRWRGSILGAEQGIKTVGTLHPSNILVNSANFRAKSTWPYIYKTIVAADIKKALDESATRDFNLPYRNIRICNDSLTLHRFLRDNEGRGTVFLDVETFNSTLVVCLSLAFDRYSSISIPLVRCINSQVKKGKKVYDVTYKIAERSDSESASIWQQLDTLFRNVYVAGQNIKFDIQKLQMLGFRFGGIRSDTVVKSHCINIELPERNLGFLASLWTREPSWKDEGKNFVYGRDPIENLLIYNARDSVVNCEIDEEMEADLESMGLTSFYHDFIMEAYPLYIEMEQNGFALDEVRSKELELKYKARLKETNRYLEEIVGHPVNPNSPKQLAHLFYNELKLPFRGRMGKPGTDEVTMTGMLANVIKDDRRRKIVETTLMAKKEAKTIGTYITFNRDFDGRARYSFNIAGTDTGRSNSTKLKEPVRPHKIGFAFQTLTKHGSVGQDIRSQFVANPGYILVSIDKSQADARVVCVLAQDWELLYAMEHGIKTHERTAALVLGLTNRLDLSPGLQIKIDPEQKFLGKKLRHAGNYDVGKGEGCKQLNKEAKKLGININISEWKMGWMLDRFHEASPKVRGVFHREVATILQETRTIRTPFGRVREFFDRSEDLAKPGFAFIPQATVIDDLRWSMIRLDRWRKARKMELWLKWVRFIGESHDAAIIQLPISEHLDMLREIQPLFEQPIDFNECTIKRDFKLTIPVEIETGMNYLDMKVVHL